MLPTLLPMLICGGLRILLPYRFPSPPQALYLLLWAVTGFLITNMEGNEGGGSGSYKDRCPLVPGLSQVLLWKGISTEKDFFSQVGRGLSSIRKRGVLWNWGVQCFQPHLCPCPKPRGPTVSPTCGPVLALETGGAMQSVLSPYNTYSTALCS